MTSAYPPYRNDEEARELVLDHLETENARLAEENATLRNENQRLKLIGSELMRAEAAPRKAGIFGMSEKDFLQIAMEMEHRNRDLQRQLAQIQQFRVRMYLVIFALVLLPPSVRMLFVLL